MSFPARGRPRLSAAERARQRRRAVGPWGRTRLRLLEAGPVQRALWTAAAAVGAGSAAVGLYLALRAPQTPPRPEPAQLARAPLEDSFGSGDGVTWPNADRKVFRFEIKTPVRAIAVLHFQSKDISQDEVRVSANGREIGAVPADAVSSTDVSHELIVPPNLLRRDPPNQVVFDNVRNPPGHESWRIWNLWVEAVQLPDLPPDLLLKRAREAIDQGQLALDRREVGAKNRYEAWRLFRSAWLMLEGSQAKPGELYRLALGKAREAQQELDRKCGELLLEEEAFYVRKDPASARTTLEHVKDYFPNGDQLCGALAEQKRVSHGL